MRVLGPPFSWFSHDHSEKFVFPAAALSSSHDLFAINFWLLVPFSTDHVDQQTRHKRASFCTDSSPQVQKVGTDGWEVDGILHEDK